MLAYLTVARMNEQTCPRRPPCTSSCSRTSKHQRMGADDQSPQPCPPRGVSHFTVSGPAGLGVGALDEQPRHNHRVHGGAVHSDWVFVTAEWVLPT